MIFTYIVIITLLVYICISITFITRMIYKQVVGTKGLNKAVTVIRDTQEVEEKRVVSSRVIPLTDEYEYDQSTKFKNIHNR